MTMMTMMTKDQMVDALKGMTFNLLFAAALKEVMNNQRLNPYDEWFPVDDYPSEFADHISDGSLPQTLISIFEDECFERTCPAEYQQFNDVLDLFAELIESLVPIPECAKAVQGILKRIEAVDEADKDALDSIESLLSKRVELPDVEDETETSTPQPTPMSNRALAREYALKFSTLAVRKRHAQSYADYLTLCMDAQALYNEMVAAGHDFSTTEMRLNDLLWELEIIPAEGDPLYEPQREDSPWRGTQPKNWERLSYLKVGHVVERRNSEADERRRSLILRIGTNDLTELNLHTNKRGTIRYNNFGQMRVKILKKITKKLTDQISKGDETALTALVDSLPPIL